MKTSKTSEVLKELNYTTSLNQDFVVHDIGTLNCIKAKVISPWQNHDAVIFHTVTRV